MKHIISIFTLMCFAFVSFGQENVVKLGLGSAFQSDLHLKYERTFAEKHSFQIGVLADFPESFDLVGIASNGTEVNDDYVARLSGFAIIPEYRYYFSSKGAPRGFYAGAYLRYRQRNLNFQNDFGTGIEIDARARLQNVGGGIGCGAQFLISDKFVIDWYIFGIGYNQFFASINVDPASPDDFDALKVELLDAIDDIEYPADQDASAAISEEDFNAFVGELRDRVEATESRGFSTRRIPFGLLDLRTGLSVGYAF